jgi:hypothetical protein
VRERDTIDFFYLFVAVYQILVQVTMLVVFLIVDVGTVAEEYENFYVTTVAAFNALLALTFLVAGCKLSSKLSEQMQKHSREQALSKDDIAHRGGREGLGDPLSFGRVLLGAGTTDRSVMEAMEVLSGGHDAREELHPRRNQRPQAAEEDAAGETKASLTMRLLQNARVKVLVIQWVCTTMLLLRAIMFALRPVFGVTLTGEAALALYPWFFYVVPEILCSVVVLVLTSPHGRDGSMADPEDTITSCECFSRCISCCASCLPTCCVELGFTLCDCDCGDRRRSDSLVSLEREASRLRGPFGERMLWRLAGRRGRDMLELVVGAGPALSTMDSDPYHHLTEVVVPEPAVAPLAVTGTPAAPRRTLDQGWV